MPGDAEIVARKAADLLAQRVAELRSPRWTPLPHQVTPPGDWYGWLLLAGRGAGKTDVCANHIVEHVKGPACLPGPVPHWVGIIAPTLGDAATSCFAGPSGIRAHDPTARMVQRPGGLTVIWPNGSEAKLFGANSADDVERLRSGGNRCSVWAEELAAWRYLADAWDHMRFGLRAGPHPHWVGSTTPKPRDLIRKLAANGIRDTVVTRASMYDNPHLPLSIREALEDAYGGTQLGRQELLGLVIDEDENALWKRSTIDAARIDAGSVPDLGRISIGVDPSGGAGEQGIIVVGKSKRLLLPPVMPVEEGLTLPPSRARHQGFVLDDRSCHLSPDGWGRKAVSAAVDWNADEIFVETNYGGAMCVSTLRTAAEAMGVNIPIRIVTATRGKAIRAQPVSALTSQGYWRHAGVFEVLEDQMTTWYPELDWSPDHLDACLVAGTLVTTRRGPVPIEAVTTDDQVMTRQGWRRVLRSWMTSSSEEVIRVDTPAGSLTGTANHRVWVLGKGFVRLDAIVWGDRLGAWHPRRSPWSSTASPTAGIRHLDTGRPGSTTPLTPTGNGFGASVNSIPRCGRRLTERAVYLAAASSITSTSILSTTTRPTSSASPALSIPGYIPETSTGEAPSGWPTWTLSGASPWTGTGVTKAGPGIPSRLLPATRTGRPALRPARLAERPTRPGMPESRGTAPEPATGVCPTGLTGTGCLLNAPSAAPGSCRASTGPCPRLAPTPVERISEPVGRRPVYDLTVEEVPEFFANGILVHNSVWNAWGQKLVHTTSRGTGRSGLGSKAASRAIG